MTCNHVKNYIEYKTESIRASLYPRSLAPRLFFFFNIILFIILFVHFSPCFSVPESQSQSSSIPNHIMSIFVFFFAGSRKTTQTTLWTRTTLWFSTPPWTPSTRLWSNTWALPRKHLCSWWVTPPPLSFLFLQRELVCYQICKQLRFIAGEKICRSTKDLV